MKRMGLSERRSCCHAKLARSTFRYRPIRQRDYRLRRRLKQLAFQRKRFGYRRLHALLRREGYEVNHKKTYRLYHEENLAVRHKRTKKISDRPRKKRPVPDRPNQRWSMDFMSDSLHDGRRFRILNVVDDATRRCVAIEVARSIPGLRVIRTLKRVLEESPSPETIVVDNGPEFTSRVLDEWASQQDITLDFIRPGRPIENAFVESFNSRFRDECLNQHWFESVSDARSTIAQWRSDYNNARPHSSLNYRTPNEVAASMAGLS